MKNGRKILVIGAAGIGYSLIAKNPRAKGLLDAASARELRPFYPSFPCVTCVVQASLTTGVAPNRHGIVSNGYWNRDLGRPSFWEQSGALVQAPRIWDAIRMRRPDFRAGLLFFQQSMGSGADVILTPAPIHKHHGGMIQDCYSQPPDLYPKILKEIGPFNLRWYWGPFTSLRATEWIVNAAKIVLRDAPLDLVYVYLPHMDYNQQRFGPAHEKVSRDLFETCGLIATLMDYARERDYVPVVASDYGIVRVAGPVHINRLLRQAGFLKIRDVRGMIYPDLAASAAFAMVDHQVAHVYVSSGDQNDVKAVLERADGIERVMDDDGKREMKIDHARSGELVALAKHDRWFAYPWWDAREKHPEYATHVDIHQKPGYDPAELFFNFFPPGVSLVAEKVGGSHGRPAASDDAAGMIIVPEELKSLDVIGRPTDLDVAKTVAEYLLRT